MYNFNKLITKNKTMKNEKSISIALFYIAFTLLSMVACKSKDKLPKPEIFGNVTSRGETSTNSVVYKIFIQDEETASNRKGIILLGSGGDENNPATGSLNGSLENDVALQLAKLGYVTAIVAYRDQPAVDFNDGGTSWNKNCEMLATDLSNVANTIISKYGSGLTRSKVITGGVSYTSYAILSNLAVSNTLADTKGFLATCGSTSQWSAQHLKIPIYNINCAGNPEGDYHGQALINEIANGTIKANSGFFEDNSCSTHCGGTDAIWATKMVDRVKVWIP